MGVPDQTSPSPVSPASPGAPPPGRRSSWAWPVAWMVVTLLVVTVPLYFLHACRKAPAETFEKAGKLVDKVGEHLQKVASAFAQGTVTTTFTSYATTLSPGQRLQFATLTQHEVFTRKDESSLAFGYIPLPDVIVEARAPVTYTYYLDLNDRWDFLLRDGVIWVTAPEIKFNKPAVDASRITYEVKKDSLLRKTAGAIENLKNTITQLSYQKAKTNIGLVRETGRRETELFVETWLAKSFADGKNFPVKVQFRNEVGTNNVVAPTVPDSDRGTR